MAKGSSKGGRSNIGGSNNTFSNETDFENSLTGFDDPRLQEYSEAYSQENSYTKTLKNNIEQSIRENGYDEIRGVALRSELKDAQKTLDDMPKKKNPAQLGEAKAMEERIEVIKDLIEKDKRVKRGDKGKRDDIDVVLKR